MQIIILPNIVMERLSWFRKEMQFRPILFFFTVAIFLASITAIAYFLFWFGMGNHLIKLPVVRTNALYTGQQFLTDRNKTAISTSGPLVIHPANPRYFADQAGNLVYLTGAHTWSNFQDTGSSDPPGAFDYTAYLDFLEANNHNFFRLWAWEQAKWGPWLASEIYFAPLPYERTGPGNALDGKPKFDLTKFNQSYFDRLRQRVISAKERGIYVSIMLFDGWSIDDKGLGSGNPWLAHPYHRDNNSNGIDGDPNRDNQGHEVHTLQVPAVTALQEAYIQKVIDTINDLDNVLFEISNESHGDSDKWQVHIINFIKEYQSNKPNQHPVGMTVEWPNGDNNELFTSPADWISPNGYFDPPAADGSKVIIADTDHIWGIGGDRQWAWKSFMRGVNPIFMDPYDCSSVWPPDPCNSNDPGWVSLRANLGYTRAYANRINLATMTPHNHLASSGYCLANPSAEGAEYLVYLPSGSTVTTLLSRVGVNRDPSIYLPADSSVNVDLSATPGELNIEWFNPESGEATAGGTIAGGASRSFTAPFAGDAVLYLYQTAPAPRFRLFLPVVGQGSVSADPPGPYGAGQQVTLSATPATGWGFTAWSGAVSGTQNPLTFAITQDTTITATFSQQAPPPTYTLTVQAGGKGQITVDPTEPYLSGQTVTVTAVPMAGWTFVGWQGALSGSTNPATLVITTNTVLTATFIQALAGSYTILARTNGNGAIAIGASDAFTEGKTIRLTALPDPNWAFVGWGGMLAGDVNPITVTLTGNLTIAADFATQVFIPMTAR